MLHHALQREKGSIKLLDWFSLVYQQDDLGESQEFTGQDWPIIFLNIAFAYPTKSNPGHQLDDHTFINMYIYIYK